MRGRPDLMPIFISAGVFFVDDTGISSNRTEQAFSNQDSGNVFVDFRNMLRGVTLPKPRLKVPYGVEPSMCGSIWPGLFIKGVTETCFGPDGCHCPSHIPAQARIRL